MKDEDNEPDIKIHSPSTCFSGSSDVQIIHSNADKILDFAKNCGYLQDLCPGMVDSEKRIYILNRDQI